MKKIFAPLILVSLLTSAHTMAKVNDDLGFNTVISLSSGVVRGEESEEDENLTSVAIGADFHKFPVEMELRYTRASSSASADLGGDTLNLNGDLDNWSIGGKLDLSWNCRASCLYLMGAYNYGENTLTAELNGEEVADAVITGNYFSWGGGFRYDFTAQLRATVEYVIFETGEQDNVDFGTSKAWMGGLAYKF
ncbi:outer membrane protein [Microbulbifer yueqingensis]|uniref:Outer membrane protein beta-barrel domain-containing protein n=1 Tax=Microbulbifer yueqingensis TaxID=658219 RepID=A0A1G8UGK4_9GAMM|nr:outer membrane beta-barrel protein [Microbulbifer yueqingensis]SDJ52315.1 Outer membrane protein beta-barrel domain-containing protein [Microbulbifer yueqingensis]